MRATPLIGREEELELLRRGQRQAEEGEGRVLLLLGEAGIGKSRLTRALLDGLASEPHLRLRYFCSPHHRNSALSPVISQIEQPPASSATTPASEKLAKLDALLARVAAEPEAVDLIADLLSLPARRPAPELSPQQRKEKTLAALLAQLDGLAREQPVLMLFEDLHWIDPTSLELLMADRRSGAAPAGAAAGDRPSGVYAALAQPCPRHDADADPPEPAGVYGFS